MRDVYSYNLARTGASAISGQRAPMTCSKVTTGDEDQDYFAIEYTSNVGLGIDGLCTVSPAVPTSYLPSNHVDVRRVAFAVDGAPVHLAIRYLNESKVSIVVDAGSDNKVGTDGAVVPVINKIAGVNCSAAGGLGEYQRVQARVLYDNLDVSSLAPNLQLSSTPSDVASWIPPTSV